MHDSQPKFSRRHLLQAGTVGAAAFGLSRFAMAGEGADEYPPVRTVTHGPKHHWFGYYDKLQFDPTQRYLLGMEVDFENRSPRADDTIRIGMVDLQDGDRWIELGETRAWCWQQGCMLQWRPGSPTEILWNDRIDDRYVCHLLDVKTRKQRTVPFPIYSVSPDGRTAVAPDFCRINDMRPGYGYAGLPDPHAEDRAPEDSGIFRIDLETGKRDLIVSLAQVAAIPYPIADLGEKKHYFNHLLINPDGTRFEFLHRWAPRDSCDCRTRMLTAALDGSDMRVVDHSGCTSHFIWRDPQHILAWSWYPGRHGSPYGHQGGFCLFEDKPGGGRVAIIGGTQMFNDGHCTYLPGNEWILNDGYPDRQRKRILFVYHVATGKIVVLGRFYNPPEYTGEFRVDLHPRFSPDGRWVVVDSPHTGQGRQMHLIDISGVV
jgi:hypothetical protein